MPASLCSTSEPLTQLFDVALLDLDGVVYVGQDAVSGVPDALAAARAAGMRLAFVTNNAARPPSAVAHHLTELGIAADPDEVITSSQAAAHYLADLLPAGSAVLVVGTTGLIEALAERGLRAVHSADDDPAAVVQGYSPDLDWRQLAEGAIGIRRGLPWVATNLDPTVPSPRGPLPGNGSLVAALRHATGVTPVATGKPDPTMHRESVQRSGAQRPIVVGDRLDTDIEGATAAGCPSLLVFSGVTTPAELLGAPDRLRPDFVAPDVSGLLYRHPAPAVAGAVATCGQWQATIDGDEIHLARSSQPGGGTSNEPADDLDPLRALCAVTWPAVDAAEIAPTWRYHGSDETAAAALRRLGLTSAARRGSA
jgi:glycerol 3-phosphatase-2